MRPDRPSRKEVLWAVALLALALALRIAFVLRQPAGFYFEDSLDFDRAARTLLETGHFDPKYYRSPVYPLLLAASYRLFGFGLAPFRILQALCTVGVCACGWLIGRRLFGERTGLLALAGTALFPIQVILPGIEYPLVPGTFLIWVALWLMFGQAGDDEWNPGRLAAAGVSVGLSILFFEGGIVAGFFLVLWALLRGRAPARERFRAATTLAAAILLTLTPWLVLMVKKGDYRPIVLRAGLHLPSTPDVDPPLWSGSGGNLLQAKLSGLIRHPGFVVRYVAREFVHFWDPYPDRLATADPKFRQELHDRDSRMVVDNWLVGDWPRHVYAVGFTGLLVAAALGALTACRAIPGSGFLVAWPLMLGVCYAPFFTQMRYRIPADPAFILLGAYAVELALRGSLWEEMRASGRALWDGWKRVALKIAVVQTFILLFLLFVFGLGPTALLLKLFRKDPMHAEKAAGSFWALRERTRERMEDCLRQF